MPLTIPDGTTCFIDANIFYYHFVEMDQLSDACSAADLSPLWSRRVCLHC
jgi:hypothetical protein